MPRHSRTPSVSAASRLTRPRRTPFRAAAGLLALTIAVTLGACSAGSSGSSSAGVAERGSVSQAPAGVAAVAPRSSGAKATPVVGSPVVNQKLVRTATLRMRVDRVGVAAADVRAIAVGLGGIVSSENISSGDPLDGTPDPVATGVGKAAGPTGPAASTSGATAGSESGTMTVQVPAAKLDAGLDQLGQGVDGFLGVPALGM